MRRGPATLPPPAPPAHPSRFARSLTRPGRGGSRGLGAALAERFLELGDHVVVCGRSADACRGVERRLAGRFPEQKVGAVRCDVGVYADQEELGRRAVELMGGVDIWVANAGLSMEGKVNVREAAPEALEAIVRTNLLGPMFSARAAFGVMAGQPDGGKVFLVDGTGAWGNATPGNAAYGATKRGLTQFLKTMQSEAQGTGVRVHMCSPGMVVTDLLVNSNRDNPKVLKFFNILAEKPATVAAWLVPRMRGVQGGGKYFKFLTTWGVMYRFATAAWRRNRFFDVDAARAAARAGAAAKKAA